MRRVGKGKKEKKKTPGKKRFNIVFSEKKVVREKEERESRTALRQGWGRRGERQG